MSSEFAVIGKPQPRMDGFEKVTGRARFTSDLTLPGMLHLKVLRSPYPHARVVSIDASKALALPGVVLVLTHKDMPAARWNPQMPILTDVARFVGDDIAVVAAISEEIAGEARDLIKVEYQVLPFVLDPEEAMKPGAPKLFPEGNVVGASGSTTVAGSGPKLTGYEIANATAVVNRGDVNKGFAEADLVYEGRYSTPFLQHATQESRVALAKWEFGKLTLWDATQTPFDVQKAVAKVLGIPMSKVHVTIDYLGGGFGDRSSPGRQSVLAAMVAKKTGRPARIELDRDEIYVAALHRYPGVIDLKYGVKKDGTLTAIQARVVADGGAYAVFGAAGLGILECMMSIYRCPNMHGHAWTISTNNPPTGPMRCVGHPQGTFAQEVHMDIIAEKLGMDPVEFRLKNYARLEDGDQFKKMPFTSNGLRECIERGAETFGWKQRWQKAGSSPGPVKKGVGVAIHGCTHGRMPPGMPLSGMVRVNGDGTVNVMTGATELGGGQRTTMAMIAAEELGVPLSVISVVSGDTESTTDTGTTSGSRQTITGGTGVKLAAADAKNQLLDVAAADLKTDKKNLTIRNGMVYVAGSDKGVPLGQIAANAPGGVIFGRGVMKIPLDIFTHTFAVDFAEVEVDTRTGEVKVLKIVAASDLGRAINPLTASSQIEGGVVLGFGFGLSEEQLLDKPTGICVNPNHLDYKVPSIKDIPDIATILVESVDKVGPFGAKGLGEPPCSPPAPAIANAIYNAIGVRFSELPINKRAVLARLKTAKG
jgi:CO/xanthine dehydrogenase Mo-binding subunit